MKNLSKTQKAIYYNESLHIFWGLLKRLRNIRNKMYRFYFVIIRRNIRRTVLKGNNETDSFQYILRKALGNFSTYNNININDKKLLISKADDIVDGYYNILGSGKVHLSPINWHQDFKSGFEWPKGKFYLKYKQVDLSNNADVKVPRELSRSHHLLYIGQAYLLTKNEKYTKEFISQIENWIDENPLMYSINWSCAMDVSIRAANWIFALNMFINSKMITEIFITKILCGLYEHGYFINRNLEKSYKISGNHYDADIAGLLIIGLLFKADIKGRQWFEFSKYALFNEIRTQVLPTGLCLDRSLNYNRLVTEFFSYSYFILVNNNYYIPPDIHYRIKSMFDFIESTTYIDGNIPNISDQDNGRYIPFGSVNKHRDASYLLAIATSFYNEPRYKSKSKITSDIFFLFGQKGVSDYNKVIDLPIKPSNCAFQDAGFFKIETNDVFLLITNGLSKYADNPFVGSSHMHADLLSFIIYKGQNELFIDPGTYVYTADQKMRNKFRSTPMHNTICIDNQSQFKMSSDNLFSFDSYADIEHIQWDVTIEKIIYMGKHNAYKWMIKDFLHTRIFDYNLETKKLAIVDKLEGQSDKVHNFKFYLHTNPKVKNEIINEKIVLKINKTKQAAIVFQDDKDGQIQILDSVCSNSYGNIQQNQKIEFSIHSKLPFKLVTIIEL
ncbi:hypothetical protein ES705_25896 [subsurface metagenome]